jgi:hypothetical protein
LIGGGENHQGIQLSTCSPMVLEHAPALDSFGAFAKPAPFAGLPRRAAGVVTMHMGGAGGTRRARTTPRQWQTRDPRTPGTERPPLLECVPLGQNARASTQARAVAAQQCVQIVPPDMVAPRVEGGVPGCTRPARWAERGAGTLCYDGCVRVRVGARVGWDGAQ